jgi:hypothetical protein
LSLEFEERLPNQLAVIDADGQTSICECLLLDVEATPKDLVLQEEDRVEVLDLNSDVANVVALRVNEQEHSASPVV